MGTDVDNVDVKSRTAIIYAESKLMPSYTDSRSPESIILPTTKNTNGVKIRVKNAGKTQATVFRFTLPGRLIISQPIATLAIRKIRPMKCKFLPRESKSVIWSLHSDAG